MATVQALRWSKPKQVATRRGLRFLRVAEPTDEFWRLWKANSAFLKQAGFSLFQNNGHWQVCWWSGHKTSEEIARASCATSATVELPSPDGKEYLPFQRAGIVFAVEQLRRRGGVLIADEMGLGKTIQAVGVLNAMPELKRVLVVCPASLKLNWVRELERWLVKPRSIVMADASTAIPGGEVVVVTNYETIVRRLGSGDAVGENAVAHGKRRFHRDALNTTPWDIVIGDELQKIKNRQAQRSAAFVSIPTRYRLGLTGTPALNRPAELFNLLHWIAPSDFPSFYPFARRYCNAQRTRWGLDCRGASNLDELRNLLRGGGFMVRRLKHDVLRELPPKRRQIVELPASGFEDELEQERETWERHEALVLQYQALSVVLRASSPDRYEAEVERLRCSVLHAFRELAHARHKLALRKAPMVAEAVVAAAEANQTPVVFAHHKDVIEQLASAVREAGFRPAVVDGDTPMEKRQAAVDMFQKGMADCFVGSIGAAGVGITLTRSALVMFAELDWVPANVTQAEDRCHRIGQHHPVLVQHYVVDGSLDAKIAKMLVQKQAVLTAMLDIGDDKRPVVPGETDSVATVPAEPLRETDYTHDEARQLHNAIRALAAACDGAFAHDGAGFNRLDAAVGREIAGRSFAVYSPKLVGLMARLVWRYRKQLGDGSDTVELARRLCGKK